MEITCEQHTGRRWKSLPRTVGDTGGGEAAPAAGLCEVSVEEGLFSLWTLGMTNVYGLVTPKRVLGNIDGVVSGLLNGTSNEEPVHIACYKFRIQSSSQGKLFNYLIDKGVLLKNIDLFIIRLDMVAGLASRCQKGFERNLNHPKAPSSSKAHGCFRMQPASLVAVGGPTTSLRVVLPLNTWLR